MTAVDAFQTAVGDTREHAGALGVTGWLKFAALILFVSLGPSIASRVGRFAALASVSGEPSDVASAPALLVIAAAGLLAIQYINAVADLVIIESLCTNRLHVREYARHNFRRGAELFGFRLALLVGAALIVTVSIIASGATTPEELRTVGPTAGTLIAAGVIVAAVMYLVVGTLTTSFVVPIMQRTDTGPIAGWQRFGASSTGNRLAVAGYVVLSWVIGGIATLFKFLISSFFTAILGGFAVLTLSAVAETTALQVTVGGIFLLSYLLFVYVVTIVINAPIKSYLWYAALELLGLCNADLDFLGVASNSDSADSRAHSVAEVTNHTDDGRNESSDDEKCE